MYNPFDNGIDKWAIDWSEGTVRVVEDTSFRVILLEDKDGKLTVLNIVRRND
jgi:hypothetical protein